MDAKVLIADDDVDSLKLIGMILEGKGYRIVAAQNGPQTVERAVNEQPDLIVLDVMMPGMDGYEVCRRLRTDPRTAHIPIVMFTAKTHVMDKVTGFEAGADEYLTKPIHPAELTSRVEVLLARSARIQATVELPPRARVIGFLGCKGGVGVSTLVANVGVTLATDVTEGKRITLFEPRRDHATLALHLGLHPRDSMETLVTYPPAALPAKAVQDQLVRHTSGVTLLGGRALPAGTLPPLPPGHVEAIARRLAAAADYLLIDMGAELREANQSLLQVLDRLIVLVEPQHLSLLLAQEMLDRLEELEFGRHRIGLVVFNRAPAAITLTKEAIESELDTQVVVMIPPAPEMAFRAAEQGVPMITLQAKSVLVDQVRSLAEHLVSM